MASRWHFIARATGERARAAHRLGRLIQHCRAAQLRRGLARGLIERGLALGGLGRLKECIEHQREGLQVATEIGDDETAHSTQIYLGYSLVFGNEFDEGEALLKDALSRVKGIDAYRRLHIDALRGLITLWTSQGRLDEAKAAMDEALALVDDTTDAYQLGILYMCSGRLELDRGDVDAAINLFQRAAIELHRIGNADVWSSDYLIATAYGRACRWDDAHAAIRQSALNSERFKAVDGIHNSHAYACLVTSKLGLWVEFETHLTHLETERPRLMSDCIDHVASTVESLGNPSPIQASRVWALCAQLYSTIGFTSKAEWAESQIS